MKWNWAIGAGLGATALIVYAATLSRGPYPGLSARLVVTAAGLFPRLTPDRPLWSGLAWLLARLLPGQPAAMLNWASALCGALSVWLLFDLVSAAVRWAIPIQHIGVRRARCASLLAGVGAALCFAFSTPFWVVSNRAHPASFHMLLLLIAARLFAAALLTRQSWLLMAFSFIYGVGTVEFATFIVLAPLCGLGLLVVLYRQERLKPGLLLAMLGCALAGLSLYPAAAWQFYGSAGYHLRDYPGFLKIIWFMWRDQYLLILHSLPRVGWLVILCITVLPWLASLFVARRGLDEERDWGFYWLHLVLLATVLTVLFHAPFAPWPMLGFQRLLVTPYLLVAMLYGYLLAYWFLAPGAWWPEQATPARPRLRVALGAALAVLLLALAAFPAWRHAAAADARRSAPLNSYAARIVRDMGERDSLITDGSMDDLIRLAAHRRGRTLRLVNVYGDRTGLYMRYVATLFERTRLRNLARIGMLPLIREWIDSTDDITHSLAIFSSPDLWVAGGRRAVPRGTLFVGAEGARAPPVADLLEQHRELWSNLWLPSPRSAHETDRAAALGAHLRRHTGMVANNLGVYFHDQSRLPEAFEAYSAARNIDTNNISALLNLSSLIAGGFETGRAPAIRTAVAGLTKTLEGRYRIWSLSRYYGYVRSPEAFADLGWSWAFSGRPGLAAASFKRALDLMPDGERPGVRMALAGAYMAGDEYDRGAAIYEAMLAEDPDAPRPLIGLAQACLRRGRLERAAELLERAEAAGVPRTQLAFQWATLHLARGRPDQARILLEELVRLAPRLLPAWATLAGVRLEQNADEGVEQCLERIEELEGVEGYYASVVRGQRALRDGDWQAAADFLDTALRRRPGSTELLVQLIKLDVLQARRIPAEDRVLRLLKLDPRNAFGHYIMGTIHFHDGELELAEDSFRRSLELQPSASALNDLAWVLQRRKDYREAEQRVREALALDDSLHSAWDTLGAILMRTDRLAEAETAFDRSLALFQGNPNVHLHMAELQIMRGHAERAQELLSLLTRSGPLLNADQQERLNRLRLRLAELE